jgi:hypothetical protein
MKYESLRITLDKEIQKEAISSKDLPKGTTDVLEKLGNGLINMLLDYQKGKSGFRRMGSEFSEDLRVNNQMLNESIGEYNSFCKILRATENKRAIPYLILNQWLPIMDESQLVLITFNKSTIGKYLFDGSQIQSSDLIAAFNSLYKYCMLKKNAVLFVVEIYSFNDYVFDETANNGYNVYYKIKKKI